MSIRLNRDTAIDAVRGFALFGILLANITFAAMPGGVAGDWWRQNWPGLTNLAAAFAIRSIFESGFILIFSFLFGYGAGRQLQRGTAYFRRRLLGLGLIGIAHALLLWPGDILLAYALAGLLLPFAVHWPLRCILRVSGLLWFAAIIGNVLVGVGLVMLDPPPLDAAAAIKLYQSGDFVQLLEARFMEWVEFYGFGLFVLMPLIAAAFLLGLATERWLAGRRPSELKQFAPDILYFLLWPAILGRLVYGAIAIAPKAWAGGGLLMPEIILRALFAPLWAAVLIVCALLFFTSPAGERLGRLFQANGRLSLSIYVSQSFVCLLLFHSLGVGLYGAISPAGCVLLAIGIFGVMTVFSWLWHRFFGHGPLERIMALIVGANERTMTGASGLKESHAP